VKKLRIILVAGLLIAFTLYGIWPRWFPGAVRESRQDLTQRQESGDEKLTTVAGRITERGPSLQKGEKSLSESMSQSKELDVRKEEGNVESLEALVEKLSSDFTTYVEDLENARPGFQSATPPLGAITLMDEVVQRLLEKCLNSGMTFEQARQRLGDMIKWVEIPLTTQAGNRVEDNLEGPGFETRSLRGDYDATPLVLYRVVTLDGQGKLILCQGAYVVAHAEHHFRTRARPYVVMKRREDVAIVYPFGEEVDIDYRSNSGMIIDAFDAGTGIPWVGLVAGPMGNGDYIRVYLSRYEEESQSWISIPVAELEDVSAWQYAASTGILTLYSYIDDISEERGTSTMDIAALVVEQAEKETVTRGGK